MADGTAAAADAAPNNDEQVEEISHRAALLRLVDDRKYADVILRGTDGVEVNGIKPHLAARSRMFDRMFYGEFRESKKTDAATGRPIVDLPFTGEVVQIVIEWALADGFRWRNGWCANGEDYAFMYLLQNDSVTPGEVNADEEKIARTLVKVVSAADYFELPGLGLKANEIAQHMINCHVPVSCVFLDEAVRLARDAATCKILNRARKEIRTRPLQVLCPVEDSFSSSSRLITTESALEMIVSDKFTLADELTLFRLVRMWACGGDDRMGAESSTADDDMDLDGAAAPPVMNPHRIDTAKRLVEEHIDLSHIRVSFICDEIEKSGLVSPDKLLVFYRNRARYYEEESGIVRNRITPRAHWEHSLSTELQWASESYFKANNPVSFLLNCGKMKEGEFHTWSIMVENHCNMIWLGIANVEDVNSINRKDFLGYQPSGWMLGSHSTAETAKRIHNQSVGDPFEPVDFPVFNCGETVRFELDLRTGRGTLLAHHIQKGTKLIIFDDLLRDDEERAFVPAVSIVKPGKVRFLGFS